MSAFFWLKVAISAATIALASELARRQPTLASLLLALPLTSILALTWMGFEGVPPEQLARVSTSVFSLVLLTLPMFLVFPALLRSGLRWELALLAAIAGNVLFLAGARWGAARLGLGLGL